MAVLVFGPTSFYLIMSRSRLAISSRRQFSISRHHKKGEYSCNKIVWERDHIHITFITVYCYSFSILLVIHLLPFLIYTIIIGLYVKGKTYVNTVWFYPRFQASTGGPGTYPSPLGYPMRGQGVGRVLEGAQWQRRSIVVVVSAPAPPNSSEDES